MKRVQTDGQAFFAVVLSLFLLGLVYAIAVVFTPNAVVFALPSGLIILIYI